jgi:hypothetical protein
MHEKNMDQRKLYTQKSTSYPGQTGPLVVTSTAVRVKDTLGHPVNIKASSPYFGWHVCTMHGILQLSKLNMEFYRLQNPARSNKPPSSRLSSQGLGYIRDLKAGCSIMERLGMESA